MKKFVSKQRLVIISIGIVLFVIFCLVTWQMKSPVLTSITGNLAAGFLTISFTVAIVDWLITKEGQKRSEDAHTMAIKSLKTLRFDVEASLADAFGFITERGYKINAKPDKKPSAYLKNIDLMNHKVYFEHALTLVKSVGDAKDRIDDILILYTHAIQPELRGLILSYRESLKTFLGWFGGEHSNKEDHIKNRINFLSTDLYDSLKSFYKDLEKYN